MVLQRGRPQGGGAPSRRPRVCRQCGAGVPASSAHSCSGCWTGVQSVSYGPTVLRSNPVCLIVHVHLDSRCRCAAAAANRLDLSLIVLKWGDKCMDGCPSATFTVHWQAGGSSNARSFVGYGGCVRCPCTFSELQPFSSAHSSSFDKVFSPAVAAAILSSSPPCNGGTAIPCVFSITTNGKVAKYLRYVER